MMFKFKKKKSRKIKVYFLCQYMQGYNKIFDVIECMKNNELFDVKVLAIPDNINLFPKNNEYEFWYSKFGTIVVNSIENNEWFDLKKEKPDYVFVQRPYDNYVPYEFQIEVLKQYTKLCYIPYAFELINLRDVAMPDYFVKNISMFFCSQSEEFEYCSNIIKNINDGVCRKAFNLGYPSLYSIVKKNNNNSAFKKIDKRNNLNIIWTPRWTTDDKLCKTSFFNYKDRLLEYIKKQKNINFVFRPHPLAFKNFIEKRIMTKKEVHNYLRQFKKSNMHYDKCSDYYDTFNDSDVLITDFSSIIIEYFLFNKPIIYCYSNCSKTTEFMNKMMNCFYCVNNWDELECVLENLKKGIDPLKKNRLKLLNNFLKGYQSNVSAKIVEEIKSDFFSL